jgi:hypothetical protein
MNDDDNHNIVTTILLVDNEPDSTSVLGMYHRSSNKPQLLQSE